MSDKTLSWQEQLDLIKREKYETQNAFDMAHAKEALRLSTKYNLPEGLIEESKAILKPDNKAKGGYIKKYAEGGGVRNVKDHMIC